MGLLYPYAGLFSSGMFYYLCQVWERVSLLSTINKMTAICFDQMMPEKSRICPNAGLNSFSANLFTDSDGKYELSISRKE